MHGGYEIEEKRFDGKISTPQILLFWRSNGQRMQEGRKCRAWKGREQSVSRTGDYGFARGQGLFFASKWCFKTNPLVRPQLRCHASMSTSDTVPAGCRKRSAVKDGMSFVGLFSAQGTDPFSMETGIFLLEPCR